MNRMRMGILAVMLLAALAGGDRRTPLAGELPTVKVYKSPTCGCCTKWADHLRSHGFAVETEDVRDVSPIKARAGIPAPLHSCHTALVGPYFVEGHVPASDVKRLVETRPELRGIAVPGMPIGSPGMEGRNPERYQVRAVDAAGRVTVYSEHGP